MTAQTLDELTLDRALLNIFVCGPGQGEAVVIALPEQGWIVIDGAGSKYDFPAHTILDAHSGDEPIELVLLTHPHRDHFYGLRELLEREDIVARTRRVGCVAQHIGTSHSFAIEANEPPSTLSVEVVKAGKTRSLLERLRSIWDEHPQKRFDATVGSTCSVGSRVDARFLAPDPSHVRQFFQNTGYLRSRISDRANDLSAVLELVYGEQRYVFGADLPSTRAGSPVRSGWDDVTLREQQRIGRQLHEHRFLKVPHHGSFEAQPMGLMKAHPDRVWACTPFNSSNLPDLNPGGGAAALLEYEEPLHLTALPRAKKARRPLPAQTSLKTLSTAVVKLRNTIGKGLVAVPAGAPKYQRACDGFWMFGFDAAGSPQAEARGTLATRLVR